MLEAGSNSFEVCSRLHALGLRAVVLESSHVGKHAKSYADNDKMAAARIALVYLSGHALLRVRLPDARSRQRRELLHAYGTVAADHTAATNSLRAYLNGNTIRPGRAKPSLCTHPSVPLQEVNGRPSKKRSSPSTSAIWPLKSVASVSSDSSPRRSAASP